MEAFQTVKKMLTSDCVLAHNDPTKDILLAYDASLYGNGAVLSLVDKDGLEKLIDFTLQRWAIILGGYNYTLQYKPGEKIIMLIQLAEYPCHNLLQRFHNQQKL